MRPSIHKLAIFIAIVFVFAAVQAASAFVPTTKYPPCSEVRFPFPPAVVFHPDAMVGNFSADEIEAAQEAMEDIHFQFNAIGGTSAFIGNLTRHPFPLRITKSLGKIDADWHGDIVPTIHVGFTALNFEDNNEGAGTFLDVDELSCYIREVFISFQIVNNSDSGAWIFTEPDGQGIDYFDAKHETPNGVYFRQIYLHELLHAFGLAHVNDSFSRLTRGDHAWLNRPAGTKMMPLPDDIAGIRYLYPAVGQRTEIGVLNTWFRPGSENIATDEVVATVTTLCAPSTGTKWYDTFSATCSRDGDYLGGTEVCPGDRIFTRVSVANFGTRSLDVRMRLFFSEDEVWNGFKGKDVAATARYEFELDAASSTQEKGVFLASEGLGYGRTYRPIIRVRGEEQFTGEVTTDWIPLSGTIKVKRGYVCNPIEQNPTALP